MTELLNKFLCPPSGLTYSYLIYQLAKIGTNTYLNVDIKCICAYYLINGPVVVTSGRNLRKGDGMKISDLANVKVNFPLAHFWIVRNGSIDVVGKPVNELVS